MSDLLRLTVLSLLLLVGFLAVLLAGPAFVVMSGSVDLHTHWSRGTRNPTGLAPDPAVTPEAVVQVYGARTLSWRGAFAVHSWVAVKPANAASYTVYEVIGWRAYRGLSPLVVAERPPDLQWFGHDPTLYVDRRGPAAEALIPQIEAAVSSYPFADSYRVWPGPNSNTFTAHVGRTVPGLRLDLPATAVGKDYLGPYTFLAWSPSGTGVQLSLGGLIGFVVGLEEGVKLTVLGLSLGVDPLDLAIDLPGIGRIGGRQA